MSLKKLAVAAGLMLFSASAFASNFRGADQVYLPAAGKLAGATGTFITDVWISNLSSDSVSVSLIYQPIGPAGDTSEPVGQDFKNVITLAPNERKEYLDFFPNVLGISAGIGQVVFNACLANADCGPATQDPDTGVSPNFRPISVEARVFQIPPNAGANPPTTGQLLPGVPWYNFVSMLQSANNLDRVFITGIINTGSAGQAGTYRTNIGLVNASTWSTTQLRVSAYQGRFRPEDKKAEAVVTLGPMGSTQQPFGSLFPSLPLGSNYFIVIEQISSTPFGTVPEGCTQGCPAYLAYGSVLDNVSGDATTLESQYLIPLTDDAILVIYPSGAGKTSARRSARH
jgi:hypothetical protein